ncbi:hypothetical protein L1987_49645 [Smallanthus sonchifolius]|uniref:Uncharacterized protein n=1 Tax=Smallanthus sonchifolius TaxID=185202 RepID=A0ACB9FWX8_9ASTR|nr:hypothetical protein L1987_49645 [Smallanthus sonchifolius]
MEFVGETKVVQVVILLLQEGNSIIVGKDEKVLQYPKDEGFEAEEGSLDGDSDLNRSGASKSFSANPDFSGEPPFLPVPASLRYRISSCIVHDHPDLRVSR